METYHAVMAKMATLQKRAQALLDAEKSRVLVEMRKVISLYNIQSSELYSADGKAITSQAAGRPAKVVKKLVLQPKYRDPTTGKTWNGHGKRPFWLGENPEDFLIDKPQPAQKPAPSALSTAKKATPVKKRPASKRTAPAKPVAKATVKPKPAAKKKPVAKKGSSAQSVAPVPTDVAPESSVTGAESSLPAA